MPRRLIISDVGLLADRGLDDALGLSDLALAQLLDVATARTRATSWAGCFANRCSGGSPAART